MARGDPLEVINFWWRFGPGDDSSRQENESNTFWERSGRHPDLD